MADPAYASTWRARASNGAVEYNATQPPTREMARAEITTCDGSDTRLIACQGAPPLDVDGGTTTGALEPLISPLIPDGGSIP
jgi:hypothetical protein